MQERAFSPDTVKVQGYKNCLDIHNLVVYWGDETKLILQYMQHFLKFLSSSHFYIDRIFFIYDFISYLNCNIEMFWKFPFKSVTSFWFLETRHSNAGCSKESSFLFDSILWKREHRDNYIIKNTYLKPKIF